MTDRALLQAAAACALAAALALLAMLAVALAHGGITQQHFEEARPALVFAAELLAARGPLTLTIAIDNVFVLFYVGALALAAWGLRGGALVPAGLVVAGATALGLLDLAENLDFLRMYAVLDMGGTLTSAEITGRMAASLFKWHVAYLTLFLFGFVIPLRGAVSLLLKLSLWLLLPAIGALLIAGPPDWRPAAALARYAGMLIGFLLIAGTAWAAGRRAAG